MHIQGRTAIVSGGASGLGAATVRRLAAEGAKVAIFDLNADLGAALAAEVDGVFVGVNVTDEASVASALDTVERDLGVATILVNCAGVGPPAKVVDRQGVPQPLDVFKRTVDVNLFGTFNTLSKFAARAMALPRAGEEHAVIINTASVAAYDAQIGQAAYGASKGGVVAMTLPLAREFATAGIRVVTIAPGLFLTPLLATLPQEAQDSLGKQVPFPSRLGDPSEYALMVQSIIANPMLNGETIRLDGAIRMAPR